MIIKVSRTNCVRNFALTQSEDHKDKIELCLNVRFWAESFDILNDERWQANRC